MKRIALSTSILSLGLLAGTALGQQNPQQQQVQQPNINVTADPSLGTMVNGRIVRTAQDQFIVQGADNKEYTFYTNPQTRYWSNNNPIQYSNLQVGSSVSAWYVPQGNRYFVNRVNVLPAAGAVAAPAPETTAVQPVQQPVQPVQQPAQVPAPQANATTYQGEVIRVSGNQVIIKTADGKEVTVYTNPQTTYQLNEQPATFTQLQPGVPVTVPYYIQNGQPYARGILGRLRNR